jgi:nanoRNase/pAp phosphatase (c-di-AMP/oligoRNAs hydrolase)
MSMCGGLTPRTGGWVESRASLNSKKGIHTSVIVIEHRFPDGSACGPVTLLTEILTSSRVLGRVL